MATIVKPVLPILRRNHPLSKGLVCFCPFYEGFSNVVNDVTLNGNNGALSTQGTQIPFWQGGAVGYSLFFNNAFAPYIDLGNNASIEFTGSSPFTIATLFNMGALTGGNNWRIVSNLTNAPYNGFEFLIPNQNIIYLQMGNAGALTATPGATTLTANTWFHGAAVYSGSDGKVYLNGKNDTSSNNAGANAVGASTFHVMVGMWPGNSSGSFFDGLIDHIAIWNRALSAAEIEMLAYDPYTMFRRPNKALKSIPPLPTMPFLSWDQRGVRSTGKRPAHPNRIQRGLIPQLQQTEAFSPPPPTVFEDKWHQPWSNLRPRAREGDVERGMTTAMRAPFTTMGQPAQVPNLLPNWFNPLSLPQLDKTKGFRRYHNTGLYRVGFSQYLAQPPKHNFQVVAQLNVTEQGDVGLFTANIVPGSGVGIRTKSAIVGIATRRPSQAFVGSAKIP